MSKDMTTVIRKVLENASVEKILEYRATVLRLYNEQMALITELLDKKGYIESNVNNK
jgi:hypothetical protein